MSQQTSHETFLLTIPTPAGDIRAEVSVPTSFIPLSDIIPLARSLGEQAISLEKERVEKAGQTISCQKGCAACCRMLVPVSPPEAFRLKASLDQWPEHQKRPILHRVSTMKDELEKAGLLGQLVQLSESRTQLSDEDMEPLNRAYYAKQLPCPFLENEVCSIYDIRPSACRELLVTSPPELCEDIEHNPVRPLPVPFRISTVLSLTWANLTQSPARLIPLPLALDWADRHTRDNKAYQTGETLLQLITGKIMKMVKKE